MTGSPRRDGGHGEDGRSVVARTQELSLARIQDVSLWGELQAQAHLSDREVQVAILLLRGRTCRVIAGQLKIAPATVHTYTQRLYHKLQVTNRAALILKLLLASGLLLKTGDSE